MTVRNAAFLVQATALVGLAAGLAGCGSDNAPGPEVSAPATPMSMEERNQFSGTCTIFGRDGLTPAARGFLTVGGDYWQTDGKNVSGLIYNGKVKVTAVYTNRWDPQNLYGVRLTAVEPTSTANGTPSVQRVFDTYAMTIHNAVEQARDDFRAAQYDITTLSHSHCPNYPALGGYGGSAVTSYSTFRPGSFGF